MFFAKQKIGNMWLKIMTNQSEQWQKNNVIASSSLRCFEETYLGDRSQICRKHALSSSEIGSSKFILWAIFRDEFRRQTNGWSHLATMQPAISSTELCERNQAFCHTTSVLTVRINDRAPPIPRVKYAR